MAVASDAFAVDALEESSCGNQVDDIDSFLARALDVDLPSRNKKGSAPTGHAPLCDSIQLKDYFLGNCGSLSANLAGSFLKASGQPGQQK